MPSISVLTPFHGSRLDYIRAAGESLSVQTLPDGWSFEWIIQIDGTDDYSLTSELDAFPFALVERNPASSGPAAARNVALTRASGTFVHTLDSDDLLLPGALDVAARALDQNVGVQWVVGQCDDLLPSGERRPYRSPLEPGLVPRSHISSYLVGDGELPVHTAGLTARTEIVRALGGWAAHPVGEDTLLFVALAEMCDGWFTPEVTWLYRKHPGQITRTPGRDDARWRTRLAERQRVQALRDLAQH